MHLRQLIFSLLILTPALAFAGNISEDLAFLDPPYGVHRPPVERTFSGSVEEASRLDRAPSRTDVEAVILKQTPVRTQGKRGTCSIFSATALLEFHLMDKFTLDSSLDLSEEWLEYLATRNRRTEGSNSWRNFSLISQFGMAEENDIPYIGLTWKSSALPSLARKRCGHLTGLSFESCLLGHRDPNLLTATVEQLLTPNSGLYDPEFLKAREKAQQIRNRYINYSDQNYIVKYVDKVRSLLSQGTPLTMGSAFYYGAWNHKTAPELGMARDFDMWFEGIVGYPEPGSVDYEVSPIKAAGHSIVLVGYDDDKIVTTTVAMADGSKKTFSYKGVYYFKNSWGQNGFGRDFKINGRSYPGYGMITQKYAHQYGTFYRLPLVASEN